MLAFFFPQQIPRPPSTDGWLLGAFVLGVAVLLSRLYRRAYRVNEPPAASPGDDHNGGSVYVLSNPGHDALVKIGWTTRGAEARAAELSSATGVPDDFEVEHEVAVANPEAVEQAVHDRLADHKVNRDREFFEVRPAEARRTIARVIGPETSTVRRSLGGILLGLTALATLALLTYHPADDSVVQSVPSLEAILHLEGGAKLPPVQNMLGLPGAWLAQVLVPEFLGYLTLVPVGLAALWGYALARGRVLRPLPAPTSLVLSGTLVAAALVGWFGPARQSAPIGWAGEGPVPSGLLHWAGAAGVDLADWMRSALGTSTSLILLLVAASGCVALLVVWWRKDGGR